MTELTGEQVLDDVTAMIRHYVAFTSEHHAPTVALWIAHTWVSSSFYVTPRAIFSSPEPGSGKTRALEVAALLCCNAKITLSTTTAALYRRIAAAVEDGKLPPTVLQDETDALFGGKATPQTEDLRALFNAGYKRGATVDRCEGDAKTMKVREFPVFAPVALAGLVGNMPATITTRAITINMRRRAPGETVAPFRERDAALEAEEIKADLVAWIQPLADELAAARPIMPDGVVDRPGEVWEALVAIGDAAGGHWPETVRAACKHFVFDSETEEISKGVRLLADLRQVFGGADRMKSETVVYKLAQIPEGVWGEYNRGFPPKPITQRQLAVILKPYAVAPKVIKMPDGSTPRGYLAADFHDAWNRYLPDPSATTATSATTQVKRVADESAVADRSATETANATDSTALTSTVAEVAPVAQESGWRPSLPAREWLLRHLADHAGPDGWVRAGDVYTAGELAGYTIAGLQKAAERCDQIEKSGISGRNAKLRVNSGRAEESA